MHWRTCVFYYIATCASEIGRNMRSEVRISAARIYTSQREENVSIDNTRKRGFRVNGESAYDRDKRQMERIPVNPETCNSWKDPMTRRAEHSRRRRETASVIIGSTSARISTMKLISGIELKLGPAKQYRKHATVMKRRCIDDFHAWKFNEWSAIARIDSAVTPASVSRELNECFSNETGLIV